MRNNPSFLEIIFVDRNGNLVQGAAQGQAMLAGQVAMAQSKWFQAAKAGQKYYSGIQTSPQGVSYIIFAMPSIQGGVLAALIQMDELWETVADIRFGESGRVFVVNQAGRIIAHANRQYILAYRDISQTTQFKEILQASGQHWVGFTNNLEGMRVLSVSAIIKPTGWIVISELPHWELHATSRLALIVIPLGLFVLMLAVFFVFMRIFARDFLRPVEILREGALRLGQGDLSFRLEPPRVLDELGEVMAAFNKMAASLESQQDTLQLSLAYEYEVKRANELMRSSAMVLALSKVASLLGSSSSSELLLDTLGVELQKLGLECGVVTVDVAGEDATVKYLSFNPVLIRNVERLAGATIKNYVIPRRYWPDDRVLREKLPVWYSNPGEMMRGMFPQVAEPIAQKALQLLDIKVETQLCMLPLISREQIIGALTIWGVDLREEDGTVFAVFASQVAGILQNALAHENETRRANELARSNAMLLALSKVAARLESSADPQEIFDMVGVELKKIGIDTMIGLFDADKQLLRIQSLSVSQEAVRWAEKVTGRSLRDLSIPRRFWPTDKVVTEKAPYWDPNGMKGTLNVFSILPEPLHRAAFKMTGIDLDDPVCYLPLADNEDVIGVLAVWGKELNRDDVPAFSILANQVGIAIKDSIRYEIEARRARELDILLKASDATSSSLDLDTVLLTLAARLLELSGFQSCHISEIDPETNMAYSRAEHSRTYWRAEKQDAYSLREYPRSRQVLLTGQPLLLQGDFEAEERHWMQELGRTAVIILALPASDGSNIGLVEIASIQKGFLFPEQTLQDCQDILTRAAPGLATPLTSNDPQSLFEIEEALLKVSAAEICSISDWDHAGDRILTCAVAANLVWPSGQGPCFDPRQDTSWQLALNQEQTSSFTRTDDGMSLTSVFDGNDQMEVESLIFFPLQKGEQRIGMVELYDFNYKTRVSPEQLTLLRTMADKASYWIENARLLQEMQKRLAEQTELLNEKEILLKEIHHRVKNNLQVISSLLNLQAGQVTDPKTVEALRESQTRVRSMALIHEKLYQSHNMARIDFGEYVKSLTVELFRSYQRGLGRVELAVHIDAVELSLEQAIPCGLLLNELVTNALKYAFPHSRQGTLWVELRIESAHLLCLRVADDGVGLPQGFDYQKAESLGLKLVHSLVAQLDGELKIAQSNGTTFQVLFRN